MSYTASAAFLEELQAAGIEQIFANLGHDYPPILEAYAEAEAAGRTLPRFVVSPHESVALSAAHGYTQVTGKPAAVFVHVDCGTENLGGAVHNASKGRIPVLIFAGGVPFTQEGELTGSRNEHIQYFQDTFHQSEIVRQYVRFEWELRTGVNIRQMTARALQFATSDPKGPVYLVGAREVMEEVVPRVELDRAAWQPVHPAALASDDVETIADALRTAHRPLIVTSYLGRNPDAVPKLVELAESLGIAVLESTPGQVNFPWTSPLHQGVQWSEQAENAALAEADVVLVLDSDVPWIPLVNRPAPTARILHVDVDPLKQDVPVFYIGAQLAARADAATALDQLNARVAASAPIDPEVRADRIAYWSERHDALLARLTAEAALPADGTMTPAFVLDQLRAHVDENTIIVNEGVSAYGLVGSHLRQSTPGGSFTQNGGSLGWNGGAAVGTKLAAPDKTVVAITGDGSFLFSVPSSVHWMARRYDTPFVQLVLDNGGWRSPKLSLEFTHPGGTAFQNAAELPITFEQPADYPAIAAAAGGAWGTTVTDATELAAALDEAFRVVRDERRCAVVAVRVQHL
ncbi:thiamine pyrophosphate-requiring protein [Galbitalea sp. SE-J8]|uniref:thiamine pyrophosphate-requiring protein n=1 Tax=Galbitalea sp. SE-J8 TaxID=3054952 RepID=UPI00259C9637|nr:thiamine pyrophosphate-requiring protein [Galbitalea sp. SE-J8]MDM4761990.1 thiamine pyrophosphate-requiring protein [Galbitalea sp. SE-J8]